MPESDDLTVYLLFLNFSNQAEDALPIKLLRHLNEQTKLANFGELQQKAKNLRKQFKALDADGQKQFRLERREPFKQQIEQILRADDTQAAADAQRMQDSAFNQIYQSREDYAKIELLREACELLRCSEESLLEYLKQLLQCRQCLKHVSKALQQCHAQILESRQVIVASQTDFRRFLKESFKQACVLTGKLEAAAGRSLKELSYKKFFFNIAGTAYVMDQFTAQIDGVERIFDGVYAQFADFYGSMRGKIHFAGNAQLLRDIFYRVCAGCTTLRCCKAYAGHIEDVFGKKVAEHRVYLTQVRFQQQDCDRIFDIFSRNGGSVLWAEEQNCYLVNGDFVNELALLLMSTVGITAEYECVYYIG